MQKYIVLIWQRYIHRKDFDSGKIWGYVSTPGFNRGNRTSQSFLLIIALLRQKLALCLERAYKTMMPINRFPIAIILFKLIIP